MLPDESDIFPEIQIHHSVFLPIGGSVSKLSFYELFEG